MTWLIIDNSNTRTKFALADEDGLSTERAWLPTVDISNETLAEIFPGRHFDTVMLCSVVPDKAAILTSYFSTRVPVQVLSYESDTGLVIDYPNPAQIGADRLANAIGVSALHGSPAIVIDFGTAVTFDVVATGPAYCGGVIAPGLGAMQDYLGKRTALLPDFELKEPESAIGKSTVEAMRSGAVHGYRGLVREIIARLREEMKGMPKIVATGGDAPLIAKGLPEIEIVAPDLTMEGIRIAAVRNRR